MSARTAVEQVNSVRLVGRLGAEAEEKILPSGSVVVNFRVVVDRPSELGSKRSVDALECAAWTARSRRSARAWRKGDLVEVEGAVRRRFFATPAGRASRVEVEVSSARMIRRAASA